MIVRIRHIESESSVYLTEVDTADEAHDIMVSVSGHGCYVSGDQTYENVTSQYVIDRTESYFEIIVD